MLTGLADTQIIVPNVLQCNINRTIYMHIYNVFSLHKLFYLLLGKLETCILSLVIGFTSSIQYQTA